MKRFFKILLYSMLCCVTVGILFSAAFIFSLNEWKDFRPEQLTNMEYSLILYDENDAEYLILDNGQNRIACDYKELPEHVKNAFLAIEDARFFEHRGIDPIRIGGALLSDLKTLSFKEGASTITQQLVKLSVLTGEKSLARKTNEIIMALKTEKYYTKDEILEMYLNRVYFGGGAYGIEAAARRYFGIHAEELTIAQAAALAGIVQSPSAYAP